MKWTDKILLLIKLSWRNIWRQKKRSFLIMSSAAVGMIGILFTIGFTNGFLSVMVDAALKSGLGHVQIRPEGFQKTGKQSLKLKNPDLLEKKLVGITDLKYSFRLEKEGILKVGNFSQGVTFIGIDPELEKGVTSFYKWIEKGKYLRQEDSVNDLVIPCVIGHVNADKMQIGPDDYVVISLTKEDGTLYSIRGVVKGVFHSASDPLDKYTVLLNRTDLSRIIQSGSHKETASYAVFLGNDMKFAETYKKDIASKVVGVKNIEVLSFSDIEPTVTRLFEMMDSFYWIMYIMIFFGYAFILFESVSMSVFERMREIGILSAIGSGSFMLFGMILFESLLLTLVGTLAGSGISQIAIWYLEFNGLSLANYAQGMESFAHSGSVIFPYLRLEDIFKGIHFSLIIAFISALYPAFKAVKISPIKAIYNR